MTRRSGDLEEISKEDSEDESFLQVCSVRRPHLLTMIVSIVEKSVEEQDDDDVDHGDIVVGDDRNDWDGEVMSPSSFQDFFYYCKLLLLNSKPDFHGDGDDEDNNQNCRDHATKNAHL